MRADGAHTGPCPFSLERRHAQPRQCQARSEAAHLGVHPAVAHQLPKALATVRAPVLLSAPAALAGVACRRLTAHAARARQRLSPPGTARPFCRPGRAGRSTSPGRRGSARAGPSDGQKRCCDPGELATGQGRGAVPFPRGQARCRWAKKGRGKCSTPGPAKASPIGTAPGGPGLRPRHCDRARPAIVSPSTRTEGQAWPRDFLRARPAGACPGRYTCPRPLGTVGPPPGHTAPGKRPGPCRLSA